MSKLQCTKIHSMSWRVWAEARLWSATLIDSKPADGDESCKMIQAMITASAFPHQLTLGSLTKDAVVSYLCSLFSMYVDLENAILDNWDTPPSFLVHIMGTSLLEHDLNKVLRNDSEQSAEPQESLRTQSLKLGAQKFIESFKSKVSSLDKMALMAFAYVLYLGRSSSRLLMPLDLQEICMLVQF